MFEIKQGRILDIERVRHMKQVAVIFGGASTEHEVSLRSATSVIQNADADKYNLILIGITKEGRWFHYTGEVEDIASGKWQEHPDLHPAIISPDTKTGGLLVLLKDGYKCIPVDVVFPVLHGRGGEDGALQGLLELSGLPYVGCGVAASANCMDKVIAKTLLSAANIPNAKWFCATPQHIETTAFTELAITAEQELGYPMFVKPSSSGSSVGVSKASDREELYTAIKHALRFDCKVLIEECVCGREVECAVMGGGQNAWASEVVGEIAATDGFYDYEGKYLNDSTDLHIPARISSQDAVTLRELAVKAYRELGCEGLSRVDFFVQEQYEDERRFVLNEINTLPGFTSISMYPKLFVAHGMSYPEIIDNLIKLAIERAGAKNREVSRG